MTSTSARRRFLDYIRSQGESEPIVSPFLPYPDVIEDALRLSGLPVGGDPMVNEIALAAARTIVRKVAGFTHIVSTADAVLPGTPGENYIAFVETAREELRKG